jgi:UTP--glucose-1-phosphate uridylyltransferase
MKIRKAIIPAAGLGTRVLPASKAVPKEMLNIVDKPAIQYIVEEAVQAGITDILIITNRGKGVIEDHFDHAFELEANLKNNPSKADIYNEVKSVAELANVYFIRQKETKGLAHAISCAKSFVGDEPFAVLYGDDVIVSEDPVIGQLCRAYEKYGCGCVGVKEVPRRTFRSTARLTLRRLKRILCRFIILSKSPLPKRLFPAIQFSEELFSRPRFSI